MHNESSTTVTLAHALRVNNNYRLNQDVEAALYKLPVAFTRRYFLASYMQSNLRAIGYVYICCSVFQSCLYGSDGDGDEVW